jgi:uncharacterized membrane protein YfcA
MAGVLDLNLAIFLLATFAAAVVAGLAGFAFGLVAAAIWLHVLTPVESASLVIGFGVIVQGMAVWKLRRSLDGRRLLPLVAGAAIGVPAGVALLGAAPPGALRAGIGGLLALYSIYALLRPALRQLGGHRPAADAAVGMLSGALGGLTGLGGILPTLWSGLRGWSKDEQRAVFQPAAVAIFLMSALWLGASGALSAHVARLFALGLPALLAGTWLGLRLYGALDERAFRRLVLGLLLVSGIALIGERL